MDHSHVANVAREAILVAILISSPILFVTLVVGVLVSVFQAVTQVQEMTLTYVPKMIGVILVVVFMGNWMLTRLVGFFHFCLEQSTRVVQ